jgi:hypothetical protein
MIAILGGILAVVLGVGLFWALRRAGPESFLMRFDDFAVVLMLGLIAMGLFAVGSGFTAGPAVAVANP